MYGLVYHLANIFDILPYGVIALGNANTHLEIGQKCVLAMVCMVILEYKKLLQII